MQKIQKGSFFVIVTLLFVFVGAGCAKNEEAKVQGQGKQTSSEQQGVNQSIKDSQNQLESASGRLAVEWSFDGEKWQALGTAPDCPQPLTLTSPVDLSKATHILYPGQIRGGNYKPHGGFRFDDAKTNEVSVMAPMDAQVVRGARYLEAGEVQYLFDFINACGIMYRFDHLHTLAPKFAEIAATFPEPKEDGSQTNNVSEPTFVTNGENIATEVGFYGTGSSRNVFLDWGVYDLRVQNSASKDSQWSQQHGKELDPYAVCWFDYLSSADEIKVRSLPAGDAQSEKKSDYCQ